MDVNVILIQSFEKWLQTLGYAGSTVYGSGRFVTDFFFYLKPLQITEIESIEPQTISNYHKYLQTRPHKTKPGALSQNYITSNINALKRFSRYLQQTGKPFFEVNLKTLSDKEPPKTILTKEEIKQLYKACANDTLGIRDRAMLSIYYGCGLRRSEGVNLDIKDILLKEKLVFVRSGKGNRERYVPMGASVREDLENYIYVAREKILSFKETHENALFLSLRAKRLCANQLVERLHKLKATARISKLAGIHSLRHSIATHLLQSGMTLEEVSRFLGHSSLESTQIYTHIVNEQETGIQL